VEGRTAVLEERPAEEHEERVEDEQSEERPQHDDRREERRVLPEPGSAGAGGPDGARH
jgi:hypothetical protein